MSTEDKVTAILIIALLMFVACFITAMSFAPQSGYEQERIRIAERDHEWYVRISNHTIGTYATLDEAIEEMAKAVKLRFETRKAYRDAKRYQTEHSNENTKP